MDSKSAQLARDRFTNRANLCCRVAHSLELRLVPVFFSRRVWISLTCLYRMIQTLLARKDAGLLTAKSGASIATMKQAWPFRALKTGIFLALVAAASAQSTPPPPANRAQALLQEARDRELDRIRNAKVRELERLNEDLEKDKHEADDLKQSVEKANAATTESTTRLMQLNVQKKQYIKLTEVAGLQIEAETLKLEGLKMLAEAQVKGVAAISKRIEETEVRSAIEKAKMAPAKNMTDREMERAALETERSLDRAQRATATARGDAREAMTAATAKLEAANKADEKTKTRAAELGVPVRGEPAPTQENVEPLQEIDPSKPSETPAETAEPQYPRAEPLHPEKLKNNL